MTRYGVLLCGKCRIFFAADLGKKTVSCPGCGKRYTIRGMRVFSDHLTPAGAAEAVRFLSAHAAKIKPPDALSVERIPSDQTDPYHHAAAIALRFSEQIIVAETVARILTDRLGKFNREDFERVYEIMGRKGADRALDSLLAMGIIFSPAPDLFSYTFPSHPSSQE